MISRPIIHDDHNVDDAAKSVDVDGVAVAAACSPAVAVTERAAVCASSQCPVCDGISSRLYHFVWLIARRVLLKLNRCLTSFSRSFV